jgi:hypothetical protein
MASIEPPCLGRCNDATYQLFPLSILDRMETLRGVRDLGCVETRTTQKPAYGAGGPNSLRCSTALPGSTARHSDSCLLAMLSGTYVRLSSSSPLPRAGHLGNVGVAAPSPHCDSGKSATGGPLWVQREWNDRPRMPGSIHEHRKQLRLLTRGGTVTSPYKC